MENKQYHLDDAIEELLETLERYLYDPKYSEWKRKPTKEDLRVLFERIKLEKILLQ